MKVRISIVGLLIGIFSVTLVAQRTNLSGLKFCIDPGHGGHSDNDRPPVFADVPYWESDGNFDKALFLKSMLENRGATVFLTRYTNDYPNDLDEPSLAARVEVANSNQVDWFHSIHSNAGYINNDYTLLLVREKRSLTDPAASTGNGLGVPERQESWQMADIIRQKIFQNDRTGSNRRDLDWTFYGGINGGYSLGVLRGLLMPGELSEGSFHDYYPEVKRLMNSQYKKMEAYAIYNSFLQYYNVPVDNYGIVAGILTDSVTGSPRNSVRVRVLPENILYVGDNYNNGYYMIDSLAPGTHTVRFEKTNYIIDSVQFTVAAGGVNFIDRTLNFSRYPIVVSTSPAKADTSILISNTMTIQFSTTMDTQSVRSAFSITPSVSGSFNWTNNNKTLTFTPAQSLLFNTIYTIQFNSILHSSSGYGLDQNDDGVAGDIYTFSFKTEPALLALKNPAVFPQVAIGDSTTIQIGVRNRSTGSITVSSISNKIGLFRCTQSLPVTIKGGDSIQIPVVFKPQTYVSVSDTLFLNSANGSISIALSGSSPMPTLYVSRSSIGYGSRIVGSSTKGTFYITSLSINPVRIDSIKLRTIYFQPSSLTMPQTLKLYDTLKIDLTFIPDAGRSYSDSVTVYNNSSTPIYRISLLGTGVATSVEEPPDALVPNTPILSQNYPNPFNPTTTISFSIPERAYVSLRIFNVVGREVAALVTGEVEAGRHVRQWNAAGCASGMYFYRLQTSSFTDTKKLVLVK